MFELNVPEGMRGMSSCGAGQGWDREGLVRWWRG